MTLALLVAAWIALVVLTKPGVIKSLATMTPRAHASAMLFLAIAHVLVPAAAVAAAFSHGLAHVGSGPFVARCGRVISIVLTDPRARPESAVALAFGLIGFGLLARGVASAWNSQAACRSLVRDRHGSRLVTPLDDPFAFTVGLLLPTVVVSQGLLDSVEESHRRVVFLHEEAHRRGRHPLQLLLVESVARGLHLPGARRVAEGFRLALENVADDYAVRRTNDRELVAETIASVALVRLGDAPAFEGNELQRVRRLLAAPTRPVSLSTIALSAAIVAANSFAGVHAVHCIHSSVVALGLKLCRIG